jgi:outer membrane protein assembly factor BamB
MHGTSVARAHSVQTAAHPQSARTAGTGTGGGAGGGVTLWQRLHVPVYQHTPNAINTSQSILYLSSPGFAPAPTLLTMVRTSDGAVLWHDSLDGTLSSGFSPTLGEALAHGQAVEVANGVVYFVVDPDHLGSPNREQELLALRADDGTELWRQPVQGAFVEVFGVSDGVVCIRVTQQQGSELVSSALSGYNARTGSLTWQRQGSDVTGSQNTSYSVILFDGILYVTGAADSALSFASLRVNALLASTGQTLWQYAEALPNAASGAQFSVYPVAAENGMVVLLANGLIGIRERDGTVLWRYQASNIIYRVPHGGGSAPGILEQGGALYFGTTAADTSLQLNSLQVTTGHLLWRQPISAAKFILWDLAVGGGSVYAILVPQWAGPHPSFDGLMLSAIEMRSGTLRWQDRPAVQALPYIAGTGAVVLLASTAGQTGLSATDGASLWHHALAFVRVIPAADGTAILSSVVSTGADTWTGTLCGLQQATGATRWCNQFATGLAEVVLGP